MIGSIILMVDTNVSMAVAMFPLLLVTGSAIIFFVVKLSPLFMVVQQKLDAVNTVLQENISGVRVVKAFVRKAYESQRFATANEEFTEHNIKVMQWMAFLFPVLTLLVNIGIVIVIWAGGIQSMQGELSVGEIVAFTNYLMTTMTPLMIMAMLANVLAAGNASLQRGFIVSLFFELDDISPLMRLLSSH